MSMVNLAILMVFGLPIVGGSLMFAVFASIMKKKEEEGNGR